MEHLNLAVQVGIEHRQTPVWVGGLTLQVVALAANILVVFVVSIRIASAWLVLLQEYYLDWVEKQIAWIFFEINVVWALSWHVRSGLVEAFVLRCEYIDVFEKKYFTQVFEIVKMAERNAANKCLLSWSWITGVDVTKHV